MYLYHILKKIAVVKFYGKAFGLTEDDIKRLDTMIKKYLRNYNRFPDLIGQFDVAIRDWQLRFEPKVNPVLNYDDEGDRWGQVGTPYWSYCVDYHFPEWYSEEKYRLSAESQLINDHGAGDQLPPGDLPEQYY
jgi:hypothetical protein